MKNKYCSFKDPITHRTCGKKCYLTLFNKSTCWRHTKLVEKIISITFALGILTTIGTFVIQYTKELPTLLFPVKYEFQILTRENSVITKQYTIKTQFTNIGNKELSNVGITLKDNIHFSIGTGEYRKSIGTLLPNKEIITQWVITPQKVGTTKIEFIIQGENFSTDTESFKLNITPTQNIDSQNLLHEKIKKLAKTLEKN